MAVYGIIDSLNGNILSGWVACDGNTDVQVIVEVDDIEVCVPVNLPRKDFDPTLQRYGFRAVLPRDVTSSELLEGVVRARAQHLDKLVELSIWEPLKQAAELENINLSNFRTALRFVAPERRAKLVEALGDTKTWRQLDKKKKLCVVTYANDASAWFPYFYEYYSQIAGPDAIYVVTPRPNSFADFLLGGVISLEGLPYDDDSRAQIMSRLCQGLQAYYSWSLICDVDEIVVPHPNGGLSFIEALDRLTCPTSISRGFDIVQLEGEPDFDFSQSVLAQRRFGVASSGMCKPHLASIPVCWGTGYHYTNVRPHFEPAGGGFLTLHLKWACNRVRMEVANIVQRTSYSTEFMAGYAHSSVVADRHPALNNPNRPIAGLVSDQMSNFERKFIEKVKYISERDLWVGEHFVSDVLFDLRGY
jgi:hypothetical protein